MTSANWAVGFPYTPSGDYGNAANWNTHVVPNEVAAFGQSYMSTVLINSALSVGGWSVFYQPYIFVAPSNVSFNGQGIVGGSGSRFDNSANLSFLNSASAGIGGNMVFNNTGTITFANSSTAGSAIFGNAGYLHFANQSTAGNSLISVTKTGIVDFTEGSTAGTANLVTAAEAGQHGRINFKGDGPAHNHKLTAGSFSGSGIFDLGANQVSVGGSNLNTTVTGQIVGGSNGRLIKVGDGVMTLTGVNTYGGGTLVLDGALVVHGAIGKVSVGGGSSTAALIGDGVFGATTALNHGYLTAGADGASPGRLATGNLDLRRGSTLAVEITGPSAGAAGYDQIVVRGTVKLAGSLDVQTILRYGDTLPTVVATIIDNDGKDKVKGLFDGHSLNDGYFHGKLEQGEAFAAGGAIYSISYKGGTGNDVVLRTESTVTEGTPGNDTINPHTPPVTQGSDRPSPRADLIYGGDGNDTVDAGGGNDTVIAGSGKDVLNGGAGKDFVTFETRLDVQVTLNGSKAATVKLGGHAEGKIKNFEDVGGGYGADKLTGDSKNNVLIGERGIDTLKGGGGDDVLVGGRDKNVLEGGSGKDQFVFLPEIEVFTADTIKDFQHGQDKLLLDRDGYSAIGEKLDASEFYAKAGAKKAHDASDHIIYDTKSGKLYYDDDGKGGDAAMHFATLSGHPTLSYSDFTIV